MLKIRDKEAEIMGGVRTIMSEQFPEDANLAVRIVKKPLGEDLEIYIKPYKSYSSLKYRKHIIGAVNSTFNTLLKTVMCRIILANDKGTYKSLLGHKEKRNIPELVQDKKGDDILEISQEIKTKVKLLKKELEFGDKENVASLYGRFDMLMKKMEVLVDEIIFIKEIEEAKANRKRKNDMG